MSLVPQHELRFPEACGLLRRSWALLNPYVTALRQKYGPTQVCVLVDVATGSEDSLLRKKVECVANPDEGTEKLLRLFRHLDEHPDDVAFLVLSGTGEMKKSHYLIVQMGAADFDIDSPDVLESPSAYFNGVDCTACVFRVLSCDHNLCTPEQFQADCGKICRLVREASRSKNWDPTRAIASALKKQKLFTAGKPYSPKAKLLGSDSLEYQPNFGVTAWREDNAQLASFVLGVLIRNVTEKSLGIIAHDLWDLASQFVDHDFMYICYAFVDREMQGRNAGGTVLATMFRTMCCEKPLLVVLAETKESESFYDKLGFRHFGVEKRFLVFEPSMKPSIELACAALQAVNPHTRAVFFDQ